MSIEYIPMGMDYDVIWVSGTSLMCTVTPDLYSWRDVVTQRSINQALVIDGVTDNIIQMTVTQR